MPTKKGGRSPPLTLDEVFVLVVLVGHALRLHPHLHLVGAGRDRECNVGAVHPRRAERHGGRLVAVGLRERDRLAVAPDAGRLHDPLRALDGHQFSRAHLARAAQIIRTPPRTDEGAVHTTLAGIIQILVVITEHETNLSLGNVPTLSDQTPYPQHRAHTILYR